MLAGCWGHGTKPQSPSPDAHLSLTKGNVVLSGTDGTEVHAAPGTALAIDHAEAHADVPHVLLENGHIHVANDVANEDHLHADQMRIDAGAHTFQLERGRAVIYHSDDGPRAVLVSDKSL